jgi:hypothetical protein
MERAIFTSPTNKKTKAIVVSVAHTLHDMVLITDLRFCSINIIGE